MCHRNGVLPVVVGHTPVVLPYRHGEPAQLLQLKATQSKGGLTTLRFDEEPTLTLSSCPSDTSPGLSTGVMNHVDEDSRPDLLKGTNVKVEPGGGGGRKRGLN